MDLANWALRSSPKFTTGVKYQFHQDFFVQMRDLEIPITLRPLIHRVKISRPNFVILVILRIVIVILMMFYDITERDKDRFDTECVEKLAPQHIPVQIRLSFGQ